MFNVGFSNNTVGFKQNNEKNTPPPLAGDIRMPIPKQPQERGPLFPQPLAGLISPPPAPKRPKDNSCPPPLAGLISPPKLPKKPQDPILPPPLAGVVSMPNINYWNKGEEAAESTKKPENK